MLFNSYEFLVVFLPLTLVGYFMVDRFVGRQAAPRLLVVCSLIFYGAWKAEYLALLVCSILFNYSVGTCLLRDGARCRKAVVTIGIAANLGVLGYFKYANFLLDTVGTLAGTDRRLPPIVLPIAISFFTFEQIAYLVDAYRRDVPYRDSSNTPCSFRSSRSSSRVRFFIIRRYCRSLTRRVASAPRRRTCRSGRRSSLSGSSRRSWSLTVSQTTRRRFSTPPSPPAT